MHSSMIKTSRPLEWTDGNQYFDRAGRNSGYSSQIANLGATIANRGYFITPHIVKEIQDNQLDSIYRTPRYTTIEKRHYESVVEGMRGAATGGTCRMLSVMVPDLKLVERRVRHRTADMTILYLWALRR